MFGERLPETWPSFSPLLPNEQGPAPTEGNSTEGFYLYEECETRPWEAGVVEAQSAIGTSLESATPPPPPRLLVILLLAVVEFSGFIKGKHFYVVSWGGKKILRHIFM